jgi:hypothetical protein
MRRVDIGDDESLDLKKGVTQAASAELDENAIRARLKQDPGDPTFADLAQSLRKRKKFEEARSICYRGLSSNPAAHRGRLVLAWIYYDEEYFPFAIREVLALRSTFPESDVVRKLLKALGVSDKECDINNSLLEDSIADNKCDETDSSSTATKLVAAVDAKNPSKKDEEYLLPSKVAVSTVVAETEIDLDDLL